MKVIDADAHVIENESTWDYMLESERQFKPKVVGATSGEPIRSIIGIVDGRLMPRSNVGRDLPVSGPRDERSRACASSTWTSSASICQVIYPTIFITPMSRRPDIDLAICAQLQPLDGRYRRKGTGSFSLGGRAAVAKHGRICRRVEVRQRERRVRRLLARLGSRAHAQRSLFLSDCMSRRARSICPICVHSANGAFTTYDFFLDDPGFSKFKLAVIGAFHSLVFHGIPAALS